MYFSDVRSQVWYKQHRWGMIEVVMVTSQYVRGHQGASKTSNKMSTWWVLDSRTHLDIWLSGKNKRARLTPWIWKGVSATLWSGRYTLSYPRGRNSKENKICLYISSKIRSFHLSSRFAWNFYRKFDQFIALLGMTSIICTLFAPITWNIII